MIEIEVTPSMIEIESVYDPLSRSTDGTITSQAPFVIHLHGLHVPCKEKVYLFLYPHGHNLQRIFITTIYRFTEEQLIVMLPLLTPGIYHPGLLVGGDAAGDDGAPRVYEFASVVWTVKRGR